ncbi:hypothetical protein B0J11DRAFT_519777 [Dendryphion nanum]|uniref:FAD-binding PCMH-type domain-containing protein n=1 Tax=Dendryphion nanum TaxID=256645 RepID=A0A9P9ECW8_9PLEO|nr:hypothetical protein B0J11DRAFT_519777 [Dendryphion nanum]
MMAELQDKCIKSALPNTCHITIPAPDSNLHDIVSRWSDAGVSLPYATVAPTTEDDLRAIISFASVNKLKVIPTNGGHGSSIPITSRTIYVDLRNFNTAELDKEKGEVKIGGGTTTREVLTALTGTGYHTLTPNSNAVGMIGALLGGLNHSMTGIFGFAIDHVQEIRILPFSSLGASAQQTSKFLTLTPSSTGEEKKLFNVVCGAGHGLGIITSVTLRAFPIAKLNLADNKVWTRRLIFPASELETAAQLFCSLLPPPPELTPVLVFLRAPPTAPNAGAPVILLALSYIGPASSAEKAVEQTFDPKYTDKALVAITAMTNWENQNDANDPLNAHGGFKEYHSALCQEIDTSSIIQSFKQWESFTGENPKARGRSFLVIASWNTATNLQNPGPKDEKFFPARDRGILVQCTPVYTDTNDKPLADAFGDAVVHQVREKDRSAGRRDWAFANNFWIGGRVDEVYGEEAREEIERVRWIWDSERLGWGFSDGWDT